VLLSNTILGFIIRIGEFEGIENIIKGEKKVQNFEQRNKIATIEQFMIVH
jgi:hypothetical protein